MYIPGLIKMMKTDPGLYRIKRIEDNLLLVTADWAQTVHIGKVVHWGDVYCELYIDYVNTFGPAVFTYLEDNIDKTDTIIPPNINLQLMVEDGTVELNLDGNPYRAFAMKDGTKRNYLKLRINLLSH